MGSGWFPDPTGRYPLRWYDGTQWTPQALDGWQRPVVDPISLPPTTPGGATSAPTPPQAPSTSPPPMALSSAIDPDPDEPEQRGPEQQRRPVIWRLALVGVAAALMAVGLLMLPWLKAWDGYGWRDVTYFQVAVAVDRYGAEFNDWEKVYHQGLAVVIALIALLGTAIAVLVAAGFPKASSDLTLLMAVMLIALMIAHMFGDPGDLPRGVVQGSAPLVFGLAYLALMAAVPQERKKPSRSR